MAVVATICQCTTAVWNEAVGRRVCDGCNLPVMLVSELESAITQVLRIEEPIDFATFGRMLANELCQDPLGKSLESSYTVPDTSYTRSYTEEQFPMALVRGLICNSLEPAVRRVSATLNIRGLVCTTEEFHTMVVAIDQYSRHRFTRGVSYWFVTALLDQYPQFLRPLIFSNSYVLPVFDPTHGCALEAYMAQLMTDLLPPQRIDTKNTFLYRDGRYDLYDRQATRIHPPTWTKIVAVVRNALGLLPLFLIKPIAMMILDYSYGPLLRHWAFPAPPPPASAAAAATNEDAVVIVPPWAAASTKRRRNAVGIVAPPPTPPPSPIAASAAGDDDDDEVVLGPKRRRLRRPAA